MSCGRAGEVGVVGGLSGFFWVGIVFFDLRVYKGIAPRRVTWVV